MTKNKQDFDVLKNASPSHDTQTAHIPTENISSVEQLSASPATVQHDSLPLPLTDTQTPVVLLVGGEDLSQKIAFLAQYAAFEVDIIDTHEKYAQKTRFPHARYVFCADYDVIGAEYAIGSQHYIVILDPSPEARRKALERELTSAARYIGMCDVNEEKENIFEALRQKGTPQTELACICCPVGLSVGALTTEEQAIAVVAELIAARAGKLLRPRPRR